MGHSSHFQPKNILIFHQSADLYGSDKMLLHLVDGLDPSRFQPIVIIPEHGALADILQRQRIETHVVPVGKIKRSVFSLGGIVGLFCELRRSFKALRQAIRGRYIDIVHSNTLAVSAGAIWAKLHRVPHLWHVHEIIIHPPTVRKLFPFVLQRFSDKVVVNSEATAAALTAVLPSLSETIEVVHNGLPVPPIPNPKQVAAFREGLSLESGQVVVTLVGRINRWKGQGLFVEAAEILADKHPELVFLMVGSPPPGQQHFFGELNSRVKLSWVREKIKLLNYTDDIWTVWAATDIAVVPSTEPEPFGLVAVEAMLMGKPVVAADHGGLREIVEHGATGLMFPPGDARALASAIGVLCVDSGMRVSMGERGRLRGLEKFGLRAFQIAFNRIYSAM